MYHEPCFICFKYLVSIRLSAQHDQSFHPHSMFVLQDSADERLTCLSPIVTRRGRRTSAAVVQRFGDWYKGDDGEVRALILAGQDSVPQAGLSCCAADALVGGGGA
jgi:hypothetical protein